jgi:hypothetical protein
MQKLCAHHIQFSIRHCHVLLEELISKTGYDKQNLILKKYKDMI